MRKRPTPSASTVATAAAPAASPMLRSRATAWPSEVRPGPRLAARAARRSASRRLASLASSGVTPTRTCPRLAVDLDQLALAQRRGLGTGDDGGEPQRPGEDGGVARRAAPDRDEREHLLRVQRHRVGRREVVRDQDEGSVALGQPGHRLPEQPGDGPVADVVEVSDALGHVAAELEQHGPEGVDCPVHCPGRGLAIGGCRSDRLLE